jgi:argininosuccinate lyase
MTNWNGRFRRPLDPHALKFSSSIEVDKRLFREDIEGSLAHIAMLARQRIVSPKEGRRIKSGLLSILREMEAGKFVPGSGNRRGGTRFVAEDIHMAIEARLINKIGPVGEKLHTARSRNDQVALDMRLYLRKTIRSIRTSLLRLQRALLSQAEKNRKVLMPGYTHLQRGQPILLAHHLLAYASMLQRDRERFADCLHRVDQSPLGAAALAGTSFPIDRAFVVRVLRMEGVIGNSIDAVGDRDVHIEFLSLCAITMMHLSRLAEELVLWNSTEWNFIDIGEEFTTGSSIMPQKRNPDIAELVRGKAGRSYGNLMTLLTVMKGLPLAYNRDMQEDKEPLFDSADTLLDSLSIMAKMVKTVRFNKDRFAHDLGFTLATDLADYLVRKGMEFRRAHAIVGGIVRMCLDRGIGLADLTTADYRSFSKLFKSDLFKLLNPSSSVLGKKSFGSTSPKEVSNSIRFWKKRLERERFK